ncbi:RidA family protein [Cupriavidus oxalaticus]|uniref:RidA family protein n=1 Tax=Cupriavidus oxalaticus TaxID=96344 RepID=UPI003179232D
MSATTPEARLAAAGLVLPNAPVPRGSYAPACLIDGRISISGQTPRRDGIAMAGCCATEADIPAACLAAEVAMLNALAALRAAAGGELAAVRQVTRLRGFVRAHGDFTRHSLVVDSASALLALAFPNQALPARTAVGVASLPDRAWIEIELEACLA